MCSLHVFLLDHWLYIYIQCLSTPIGSVFTRPLFDRRFCVFLSFAEQIPNLHVVIRFLWFCVNHVT